MTAIFQRFLIGRVSGRSNCVDCFLDAPGTDYTPRIDEAMWFADREQAHKSIGCTMTEKICNATVYVRVET